MRQFALLALAALPFTMGADGGCGTTTAPGLVKFEDTYWGTVWTDPAPGHCSADGSGMPGHGGISGLYGYAPSTQARSPVFVYFVGSGGLYNLDPAVDALLQAVAQRGYVAAVVQYDNFDIWSCSESGPDERLKAYCVFSPDNPQNAIVKLCGRAEADCDKGIVAAGMSQGGMLAMLGHDYDPRVRAVWATSVSDHIAALGGIDATACLDDPSVDPASTRTLAADRLRVVDGSRDALALGGPSAGDETYLRNLALAPSETGAGYHRVVADDLSVAPGSVNSLGHCFYTDGTTEGCDVLNGINGSAASLTNDGAVTTASGLVDMAPSIGGGAIMVNGRKLTVAAYVSQSSVTLVESVPTDPANGALTWSIPIQPTEEPDLAPGGARSSTSPAGYDANLDWLDSFVSH